MFQSQDNRIQEGIIIDNIDNFMTEEILWLKLHRDYHLKVAQIKLPRDKETKKLKGYAFVGFDDLKEATRAKKELNFKKLSSNIVRVALIGDLDQKANVLISNIPKDFTARQIDEFFQQWGVVMSSKLAQTPNGETDNFGYVQFQNSEDAQKCITDCQSGNIKLGENVITADIYERYNPTTSLKKNLYMKDYKETYTSEQMTNETFVEEETKRIAIMLRDKLSAFGDIISVFVKFSLPFQKPFCFVCFSQSGEAERALAGLNQDQDFPFNFKTWAKTQAELQQERESMADKRYLFFKNLQRTTTEERLREVLAVKSNVTSIRIKTPVSSKYNTNYATVIIENEDKLGEIKQFAKDENSDLNKLFEPGKRPFVSMLHPKKFHKNYIHHQYEQNQLKFMAQAQPHLFYQPPPMMANQPNMQTIMQYYQQMQMMGQMPPPNMMPPPMMNMNFMGPMQGMGGMHQQPFGGQNFNRQRGPYQGPPRGMQNQGGFNQNRNFQQGGQRNFQQQGQFRGHQQRGQFQQNNNRNPRARQVQPPMGPPGGLQQQPVQPPQQQPQQQQQVTFSWIVSHIDEFKRWDEEKQRKVLGGIIYPKVLEVIDSDDKSLAPKVTGMLIDFEVFPVEEIIQFVSEKEEFIDKVKEAKELIASENN